MKKMTVNQMPRDFYAADMLVGNCSANHSGQSVQRGQYPAEKVAMEPRIYDCELRAAKEVSTVGRLPRSRNFVGSKSVSYPRRDS
jgi:hypothetical protein